MINKKILLGLLVGLTLTASAEILTAKNFNLGIDYNGYYSDNIFINATQVKDYVSQFHADFNYSIKNFNIYLDAAAGVYADNPEFNSFTMEPGFEWFHSLKKRNSLYLNFNYTVLSYKELYTDFNYQGPRFQANVKFHTSQASIVKAEYVFELRNYANYESFDFSNHSAFVEINRFFKTQTTLKLQAGFNYRYYPHIAADYDFGDNYNYYERHKHQGKGPHHPGGGQRQFQTYPIGIPNLRGMVHITQAMGTRLGITGEAEVRRNFRGLDNAETLIKNAYILYPFNDDYLWDGLRLSLGLKTVPWKDVSVEGSFSYFDKRYRGVYIMDAAGNIKEPAVERADSLLLYTFKVSKKIGKFDVFAHLSYRDNDSNDDYFFYKMVTISFEIGYYF